MSAASTWRRGGVSRRRHDGSATAASWRRHIGVTAAAKKGKGSFYIALYPVRWTAQSFVFTFYPP